MSLSPSGVPPLNHRSIARRLGLYSFDAAVPSGMSWYPRDWVLHRVLEEHVLRRLQLLGFEEVRTPAATCNHIVGASVRTNDDGSQRAEAIRADLGHGSGHRRSCGGHLRLFDAGLKSWRDLPTRYPEFVESGGADKNLDCFHGIRPRLLRYSIGLLPPRDILMRVSLYQRM